MKNSDKPKILAFIDWYLPGYKAGGTITAFGNFVDYLENDIDFKIVTRSTDYLETESYPGIKENEWNKRSETSVHYISSNQLNSKYIKELIHNTSYDWLYVNGIFSYKFSILPVWFSNGKNCVVNPHGMLSEQAFSVKKSKKKIFLSVANLLKLYKNVRFHVANEVEANDVRKNIKEFKDIKVINQLPRKFNSENAFLNKQTLSSPIKLVSVSRISVEKGILKMLDALSTIKKAVILDIYGPIYDEAYWKKCKSRIETLPSNVKVTHKGSIDGAKIIETLRNYHFFILLSEGENFGHAILEALSAGCPVIISNKTPWKDLEDKNIGWDVNVDDSQKIQSVFEGIMNMQDDAYQKMSSKAVQFAKDFSDNPKMLNQNLSLFLN